MRFTDKKPTHHIERSNAVMVLEGVSFQLGVPGNIRLEVSYEQMGALKTCVVLFVNYLSEGSVEDELSFGNTRSERPWIDLNNARNVTIKAHSEDAFDFRLFFEMKPA